MKKLIYTIVILLFSLNGYTQSELSYGLKAGLNYNSNGDLNIFGGLAGLNDIFKSNDEVGYQAGAYIKYDIDKLYFKSELLFSKTSSSYEYNQSASKLKISSVEVPILIGYTFIKPLSIYAGPSSRYIVNTDFSSSFDLEIDKTIVLDLNFGVTLQLDKFGIDLRYIIGLSENKASYVNNLFVDGFGYAIDTKPKLFTLSLSYQIN